MRLALALALVASLQGPGPAPEVRTLRELTGLEPSRSEFEDVWGCSPALHDADWARLRARVAELRLRWDAQAQAYRARATPADGD